jgi:CheY-like chemotaxis protein
MEELGRDLVARMLTAGEVGVGPTAQAHAMQPIVDHVVRMLTPTLPHDVTLDVEPGAFTPELSVRMEPIELQQVLLQLVLNAREAHHNIPGVIAIAMAMDQCNGDGQACQSCTRPVCGSHVRLQVRDEGTGMDTETLTRAFEPFFTTKAAREHAGLGLSIVQALTHKAGGHIRVSSTPSQGSVFEILLPREAPANHEACSTAAHPATASAPACSTPRPPHDTPAGEPRRRRVWLVTPALQTALYLADQLQSHGIEARCFTDSTQCLRAFVAQPDGLDVLLAEHQLPHLTGPALVRAMVAVRPDLLCVLCTHPDQPDEEQAARAAGASVVLPKPFVLVDLLRAVLPDASELPATHQFSEASAP